jgi:hypothetical protein
MSEYVAAPPILHALGSAIGHDIISVLEIGFGVTPRPESACGERSSGTPWAHGIRVRSGRCSFGRFPYLSYRTGRIMR